MTRSIADTSPRPLRLRSADSSSYVKPRLRTKFGERVSGFALGPRVAIVEVGDVCVTIRL